MFFNISGCYHCHFISDISVSAVGIQALEAMIGVVVASHDCAGIVGIVGVVVNNSDEVVEGVAIVEFVLLVVVLIKAIEWVVHRPQSNIQGCCFPGQIQTYLNYPQVETAVWLYP